MTSTQPNINSCFKARRSSRKTTIVGKGNKVLNPRQKLNDLNIIKEITPKRKLEDEESTNSKRHKGETSSDRTPIESSNDNLMRETEKNKSVRKLDMNNISQITPSKTEDKIQTVKKNPTPEELKALLGKCNRLDILRSRLVKATQCNDRLRAFQSEIHGDSTSLSSRIKSPRKKVPHPQLEEFTSLDIAVPISPSASPFKSPLKTPIKTPAYLKYSDLASKFSLELKLPASYDFIKKIFIAVDRVSSILYNRPEIITFNKLKTSVQQAIKRAFNMTHLGQIKFVFPDAYKFVWEKIKGSGLIQSKEGCFELVLQPILNHKGAMAAKNLTDAFNNKSALSTCTPQFVKMDNIVMAKRENIFHNLLLGILKQHHQEYLKSLNLPMHCDDTKIKRWHPNFLLHSDIPDVDVTELPEAPEVNIINNAQDMLAKSREIFSVNPRLLNAVETAAATNTEKAIPKVEEIKVVSPAANTALKGISMSLLAKVRAREAEKATRQMTRSKDENDELERLSRLPELARIVRNIFISEKKAALTWEFVTGKLTASHSSNISQRDVDLHLNLLMKEIPNWCIVHKVRCGIYLKLDKNRQLNEITAKLDQLVKHR